MNVVDRSSFSKVAELYSWLYLRIWASCASFHMDFHHRPGDR